MFNIKFNKLSNIFNHNDKHKESQQISNDIIKTNQSSEMLRSNLKKINLIMSRISQNDKEFLLNVNNISDFISDIDENEEFIEFSNNFNLFLLNYKRILNSDFCNENESLIKDSGQTSTDDDFSSIREISVNLSGLLEQSSEVNANADFVSTVFTELVNTSKEITIHITDATDITKLAAENARSVAGVVEKLKDGFGEIGEIVNIINGITKQINLLSLNATIEAARAGEAGRGFVVVANAIKSLANETDVATRNIRKNIESVQTDSKHAISFILEVAESINSIFEKFSLIASSVETENVMTNELDRVMSETVNGLKQISEKISSVCETTSKMLE